MEVLFPKYDTIPTFVPGTPLLSQNKAENPRQNMLKMITNILFMFNKVQFLPYVGKFAQVKNVPNRFLPDFI